jgi:hypothetical protein
MKAIIFGPDEDSCSEESRRELAERKAHIRRRGYNLVAYASSIDMVLSALAEGAAQVVLFAHAEGAGAPRMTAGDSIAFLRPRPLTPARVRAIVEMDATGPIGLDPETIAAARRISRRLAEMGAGPSSPSVQGQGCN